MGSACCYSVASFKYHKNTFSTTWIFHLSHLIHDDVPRHTHTQTLHWNNCTVQWPLTKYSFLTLQQTLDSSTFHIRGVWQVNAFRKYSKFSTKIWGIPQYIYSMKSERLKGDRRCLQMCVITDLDFSLLQIKICSHRGLSFMTTCLVDKCQYLREIYCIYVSGWITKYEGRTVL